MEEFAIREKLLRLECDYTLKQVAEGTGLTESAVSRYESGKREPNGRIISYFCKFYGVSADYLLGLTNDKHGKYGPDYIVNGMIIETLPTHSAGHRTVQAKPRIEDEENIG